jgi:catechol 2,3-dioxygenase-like lactoylglutathione lyase family enzyme
MAELPPPPARIVLAHFIVSDDVERSRRFYTEVLGGRLAFSGDVTYVALSNSWIIINVGGGPTDDKPAVTLQTPPDPDRVSSFLNIRDPDGHLIEVGQTTDPDGDWVPAHWPSSTPAEESR